MLVGAVRVVEASGSMGVDNKLGASTTSRLDLDLDLLNGFSRGIDSNTDFIAAILIIEQVRHVIVWPLELLVNRNYLQGVFVLLVLVHLFEGPVDLRLLGGSTTMTIVGNHIQMRLTDCST